MKRKMIGKMIAPLAIASALMMAMGGCTKDTEQGNTDKPVTTLEPAESNDPVADSDATVEAEPTQAPEAEKEPETENEPETEKEPEQVQESTVERADGERYEDVIMLEGMEETVNYEHAANADLGIGIDLEYESLARKKSADSERFVSIYDDANKPENYLELTRSTESAEAAVERISNELSKEYDLYKDEITLDNAGRCLRIDASAEVGGQVMPEQLQKVYIIPTSDGCIIGTAHYSIEAAEGFGHRFLYMMNTLTVK